MSGWERVPDTRDVRPQIHSHAFLYESCDVPEGMTLSEYRKAIEPEERKPWIRRMIGR